MTSSIFTGRGEGICEVGTCISKSRYECPRCATAFCSVPCYQSHSGSCVSAFTADDRSSRLRGVLATDEEQSHMRDVLARLAAEDAHGSSSERDPHEFPDTSRKESGEEADDSRNFVWNESDSSSERSDSLFDESSEQGSEVGSEEDADKDVEILETRDGDEIGDDEADRLEALLEDMEQLDMDPNEALARLPQGLAEEFRNQVGDGRISRLVQLWQPWWLPSKGTTAKENGDWESEEEEETEGCENEKAVSQQSQYPRLPSLQDFDIAPESAVSRASSLLIYSTVDVLISYCITLRYQNGDWRSSPSAASHKLWQTSGVLAEDARHGSCGEAAKSVAFRADNYEAGVEAASDAAAVLLIDAGVERAMLETRDMMNAGASSGAREARAAVKKSGFLLAFAAGINRDPCGRDQLDAVSKELTEWAAAERAYGRRRRMLREEVQNNPISIRRTIDQGKPVHSKIVQV